MKTRLMHILAIATLFVGLFINSSNGQAFTLESFDGSKQLIIVSLNDSKSILSIKCANDAIYIRGINYVDTVHLLNKNFLLIIYHFRAGSGMKAAKTMLLSTNNHTMYESLHITSLFKEEFLDFSKPITSFESLKAHVETIHHVDLLLTEVSSTNYKIKATIHDERKSINEPTTNYKNDIVSTLIFDRNKNIFYSSQEEIAPYFIRAYAKIKHSDNQVIKGVFPVAKLGKQKFYYKAGKWHELPEPPQ